MNFNMNYYSEEKFDQLVDEINQNGPVGRREFFRRCALLGVSLTTVVQVLEATKARAAAPSAFPPNWNPYPFEWGMNPIADNPDDAVKWWLARMKDSGVPDTDPSVVLTEDEIKQLQTSKPRGGTLLVQPSGSRHRWLEQFLEAGSVQVGRGRLGL